MVGRYEDREPFGSAVTAKFPTVREEDLRVAVERTAAYVSQLPTERKVVANG
jgi:hypothetical protein